MIATPAMTTMPMMVPLMMVMMMMTADGTIDDKSWLLWQMKHTHLHVSR